MPSPFVVTFSAGTSGPWLVDCVDAVAGKGLKPAPRLDITVSAETSGNRVWSLRGVVSNTRYTRRDELTALAAKQEGLGRPSALRAALIPIRKSEAWWALAQDERRAIFEETSRHIEIGLAYLPAIARRLHHSRDLGEPFDFLTWFEYAPEHSEAFEEMVRRLRATEEWQFVEREVDIRLTRRP